MKVLLLLAHAIEEYDQLRLLTELGYDVFSIGGYSDPANPSDDKRPALPFAANHPDLRAACHAKRVEHGDEQIMTPDGLHDPVDWAKADLPDEVLDWADTIIVHHFEHTWLVPQWARLRASGKRIIWRTVGQSVEHNERMMAPLRAEGLEIVRYSPKEAAIPGYAGADALIRFYKDEREWAGWVGDEPRVINITQHLKQRDPYTNWGFWDAATQGLLSTALGPGSEEIGGPGALDFPVMQAALRSARVYLYTGTQPASYTLGLIEAMMTGIPVVSIGPKWMTVFPYGPDLFEGLELTGRGSNYASIARSQLRTLLEDHDAARDLSQRQQAFVRAEFGRDTVGAAWKAFLG